MAQLNSASDYGSEGWGFESLRGHICKDSLLVAGLSFLVSHLVLQIPLGFYHISSYFKIIVNCRYKLNFMKYNFLLFFWALVTTFSCKNEVFIGYGEKISTDEKFYKKIEGNLGITNLSGEVISVCPKKGCWMNVKVDNDTVFVKFKDYGFFVPKNGIEGKKVLMSGKIFSDTISVERLRHYAEDAQLSLEEIENITQPEYKINMIANGVAILED